MGRIAPKSFHHREFASKVISNLRIGAIGVRCQTPVQTNHGSRVFRSARPCLSAQPLSGLQQSPVPRIKSMSLKYDPASEPQHISARAFRCVHRLVRSDDLLKMWGSEVVCEISGQTAMTCAPYSAQVISFQGIRVKSFRIGELEPLCQTPVQTNHGSWIFSRARSCFLVFINLKPNIER